MINNFFKLKENNTTIGKELIGGATTFFAMVYIIFVNPSILSQTGIPWGGVFLATIIATVIGTLIMGLFANVPYALAPGMGLNAFFTFTVCFGLGFNWKEALALVFICGIFNVLITVTKVRKHIIKAIPVSLQHAIGGGIGVFIAFIGLKNAGMLQFTANPGSWFALNFGQPIDPNTHTALIDSSIVPALTDFSTALPILAVIGLIIMVILLLFKVKGAILIGIAATTIIGIPMGITKVTGLFDNYDLVKPFKELGQVFGQCFVGFGTLFSKPERIPMAILAIFAFSLSDTFDTIGTFIGTGRKSGIFTEEDLIAVENTKGFKTKMDKALFADAIATSIGAICGTSNTTTYVESAAGIEAGGRTGLSSVVTSIMFLLCIFISPIAGIVPAAATAPALIIVGIMMLSSFKEINWDDFAEAVPAFFAGIMMAFCYNISLGIAFAFIFYCMVKVCKKQFKDIHPIMWGSAGLFLIYFIVMALHGAKVF